MSLVCRSKSQNFYPCGAVYSDGSSKKYKKCHGEIKNKKGV